MQCAWHTSQVGGDQRNVVHRVFGFLKGREIEAAPTTHGVKEETVLVDFQEALNNVHDAATVGRHPLVAHVAETAGKRVKGMGSRLAAHDTREKAMVDEIWTLCVCGRGRGLKEGYPLIADLSWDKDREIKQVLGETMRVYRQGGGSDVTIATVAAYKVSREFMSANACLATTRMLFSIKYL